MERNWFIGIRTPWTLSSERVWKKTNWLAGKLFRIAGIIAILGAFFPELAFFFILSPALLIAGSTAVYSDFKYQKEIRQTESQIKT